MLRALLTTLTAVGVITVLSSGCVVEERRGHCPGGYWIEGHYGPRGRWHSGHWRCPGAVEVIEVD